MKKDKFGYLKRDAKAAGWQASLPLGAGNQGFVSLWIKTNAHGQIPECKAVKDTYDPDWENCYPLKQFSEDKLLPMELGVLYALKHAKANAPAGSLMSARGLVNDPIPSVLGHAVNKGHLQRALEGWRVIVHRDIKPENIFLGPMSSNEYLLYPVPKLADFGLAYVVDPAEDAIGIGGPGTRNYKAPEQEGHEYMPLSTQTNIYGIGITLMALMNLDKETGGNIDWDHGPFPDFDDNGKQYSETLRDLLSQCTKFDVQERIGLDELRASLETLTAPGDEDLSQGFSRMPAAHTSSWRNGPHDLKLQPDPYRLTLSFAVSIDEESGAGEPRTDDEEESEQGEEATERSEDTDDESMED
ncbi:hypothetical protein LTR95_011124 [Oleoguttula sp. CCFEE 5521]